MAFKDEFSAFINDQDGNTEQTKAFVWNFWTPQGYSDDKVEYCFQHALSMKNPESNEIAQTLLGMYYHSRFADFDRSQLYYSIPASNRNPWACLFLRLLHQQFPTKPVDQADVLKWRHAAVSFLSEEVVTTWENNPRFKSQIADDAISVIEVSAPLSDNFKQDEDINNENTVVTSQRQVDPYTQVWAIKRWESSRDPEDLKELHWPQPRDDIYFSKFLMGLIDYDVTLFPKDYGPQDDIEAESLLQGTFFLNQLIKEPQKKLTHEQFESAFLTLQYLLTNRADQWEKRQPLIDAITKQADFFDRLTILVRVYQSYTLPIEILNVVSKEQASLLNGLLFLNRIDSALKENTKSISFRDPVTEKMIEDATKAIEWGREKNLPFNEGLEHKIFLSKIYMHINTQQLDTVLTELSELSEKEMERFCFPLLIMCADLFEKEPSSHWLENREEWFLLLWDLLGKIEVNAETETEIQRVTELLHRLTNSSPSSELYPPLISSIYIPTLYGARFIHVTFTLTASTLFKIIRTILSKDAQFENAEYLGLLTNAAEENIEDLKKLINFTEVRNILKRTLTSCDGNIHLLIDKNDFSKKIILKEKDYTFSLASAEIKDKERVLAYSADSKPSFSMLKKIFQRIHSERNFSELEEKARNGDERAQIQQAIQLYLNKNSKADVYKKDNSWLGLFSQHADLFQWQTYLAETNLDDLFNDYLLLGKDKEQRIASLRESLIKNNVLQSEKEGCIQDLAGRLVWHRLENYLAINYKFAQQYFKKFVELIVDLEKMPTRETIVEHLENLPKPGKFEFKAKEINQKYCQLLNEIKMLSEDKFCHFFEKYLESVAGRKINPSEMIDLLKQIEDEKESRAYVAQLYSPPKNN